MMSKWTICSEKTSDWLIFSERPEPFAHSRSFVMSGLSDSLTSLFKKEGMSESLRIFKLTKKCTKNMILFNFFSKSLVFVSKRAIERFAKKNKQFAHLLFYHEWPEQIAHSWAIFSQLLICHEQPEQFPHSCSFVLSDLSKLLKVTHYNEQFWANEQWANELISKFPTLESSKKPSQIFLSYESQPKFVLNILVIKVKKRPKYFYLGYQFFPV